MKKILLGLIIISLVFIPVVSAGFFDPFVDTWSFFTGKYLTVQDHCAEGDTSCDYSSGSYNTETCGNGFCGSGEDSSNCPYDCSGSAGSGGSYCGNYVCDSGESSSSCPGDCGSSGYCGDYYCDSSESSSSCPSDCGSSGSGSSGYCGDSYCNNGETTASCPSDCGSSGSGSSGYCGDYWCSGTETATSCPSDCGSSGSGTGYGAPSTSCYTYGNDQTACSTAGCVWYGTYCDDAAHGGSGVGTGSKTCSDSICAPGDSCTGSWVTGTTSSYCCKGTCKTTANSATAYCGNGVCDSGESKDNCNYDCGTSSGAPSNTCSASNYWQCYTKSTCTGVGASWCGSYCSLDCPTCSESEPWNCFSSSECSTAGGSWCGTYCSDYCPSYTCSTKELWNCYDSGDCVESGGSWCGTYCSSSCPTCSESKPWNCNSDSECTAAGANWCGNWCSDYECPQCSSDKLWGCNAESDCIGAEGNWCGNYCSDYECPTCSENQPWNCASTTSCEDAGGNWCESDYGSGWCSDYECPSYSCSSTEPWNCYSEPTCKDAGANWCGSYCSSKSCPTFECSLSSTGYCDTEKECKDVGGSWCGDYCQKSVCPSCDVSKPWNCNEKSSCEVAGANWCESSGSGSDWCTTSSCPTCSKKAPWNCYSEKECNSNDGEWCGNYCSSDCPVCKDGSYWNCYDQSSCSTAGGEWCKSDYQSPVSYSIGATGWCEESCPSCDANTPWNCYSRAECEGSGADWCGTYCSESCPTCSEKQPWNCYTKSECNNAEGNWCGDWCSDYDCPTCSLKEPWNCNEETECIASGANWCGEGDYSWCTKSSCPTCSEKDPWSCYTKKECTGVGGDWCEDTTGHNWCSNYGCPSYECSETNLWDCKSEDVCIEANGAWCGKQCKSFCPAVCGDGVCGVGEKISNCPNDCKVAVCPSSLLVSFSKANYKVADQVEMSIISTANVDVNLELSIDGKKSENIVVNTGSTGTYKYTQKIEDYTPPGKYSVKAATKVEECKVVKAEAVTQITSSGYCGDKVCGSLENKETCPRDCGGNYCPDTKLCLDGTEASCSNIGNRCVCEPCLFDETLLPEGCYQKIDAKTGFVSIKCDTVCEPPLSNTKKLKELCIETGGKASQKEDKNGCTYLDCNFGKEGDIYNLDECMGSAKIEEIEDKCERLGLPFHVKVSGLSCQTAYCAQKDKEQSICQVLTLTERTELEASCTLQGLQTVYSINDVTGCDEWVCGTPDQCIQQVPQAAYDRCRLDKGEMVVQTDEDGCVVYSECLDHISDRDIYVGPIKEIPTTVDLLSMVLRLENLKIKVIELTDKAQVVYEFYLSQEDPEVVRYERVVLGLEGIQSEIENIEEQIRVIATEDITEDQVYQIKYDIKYLHVMFQDVLVLALSTGENIKGLAEGEIEECGTETDCFKRAFRICQPATYTPGDEELMTFEILGLEEGSCMIYAVLEDGEALDGQTPPYSMECLIDSYSRGMRSASEDMLSYCEGSLVDYMNMYYYTEDAVEEIEEVEETEETEDEAEEVEETEETEDEAEEVEETEETEDEAEEVEETEAEEEVL
jgi:hypothetical protein